MRHPELSKVRKRVRKPKKKQSHGMSNINIIPMSMGMMILRQFNQDLNSSDENERDDGSERGDTMDSHDVDDEDVDDGDVDDGDDDEVSAFKNEDSNEMEADDERVFASENMEKTDDKYGDLDKKSETVESERMDEIYSQNGAKKVGIKCTGNDSVVDSLDKIDEGSKESVSDYGSDDEVLDEVATANSRASLTDEIDRELNQALESRMNEMRRMISEEISASRSHDPQKSPSPIVPPDMSLSDSDEDDESKKFNVEEFIRQGARETAPPRKTRYSSNTSVDTSTTSGIGSYNESYNDEHLYTDICNTDSQKTSPGWTNLETEVNGKQNCDKTTIKDGKNMTESQSGDEEQEFEEEEIIMKGKLSEYLRQDVECLPLPSALKNYLLFYRNVESM